MLQTITQRTYACGFYALKAHDSKIMEKGYRIQDKFEQGVRAKLFFKWYERYYTQAQKSFKLYYKVLKRKAFTLLNLNLRKAYLKNTKAKQFYLQNLKSRGIQIWSQTAKQLSKKRADKENLSHKSLVEIQPIIDKDISNAYIVKKPTSPNNEIQQQRSSQPVFNVFTNNHMMKPMLYKTGGSAN